MKRLYDKFTFEIIAITISVTGLVANDLKWMLKRTGIENINDFTLKCQKSALLGTLKIVKSFVENGNDLNLHSAMIGDNFAFQTKIAVIAAVLL